MRRLFKKPKHLGRDSRHALVDSNGELDALMGDGQLALKVETKQETKVNANDTTEDMEREPTKRLMRPTT